MTSSPKKQSKFLNRLAEENGLAPEWLDELLKTYHEKRVRNETLEEKDILRLLNEQLDKVGNP